ncbi:hypothetical protein BYT27DRAFT_7086866, partial [Phlegmacium glaucopus]
MSCLILLACLPLVTAAPTQNEFPDITFKVFNDFVTTNFSSKVSLATVLLVLFSLTDNPDLLNLHARQQHPSCSGEKKSASSGWIKCLAQTLQSHLEHQTLDLFKKSENPKDIEDNDIVTSLALKLGAFAQILNLNPYHKNGKFDKKLLPISHKAIQPVLVICPTSFTCEDTRCEPRGLLQNTRVRDIPSVTLIKGITIYQNVPVLTGVCTTCNTTYSADHERI